MARITEIKEPTPFTIENFLGLNMPKSGDTQIMVGESGNMLNCYITKDYDLSKMYGYLQLMTTTGHQIQGMWYGNISGTNYFLFATDGHIYSLDNGYWFNSVSTTDWSTVVTDLGTLTDAHTEFFSFDNKVYILNGNEYKYWNGTGSIADVAGFIPKINISCSPTTGTGTPYENLNLLTGKKHQTYNGDNATLIYKLVETDIGSVDYIYLNGSTTPLTVTTDYSVDLSAGTITFVVAPTTGLDNVDIYWTKGTGDRNYVLNMTRPCLFGDGKDTRVFLYGHPTYKNLRINSTTTIVGGLGVPSVEYFTETNMDYVGGSETAITLIKRQQNMIINNKPNETYYSVPDTVNLDGIDYTSFPYYIINDTRGNIPMGQGQVLNNDLFTIDTQLIKWTPTTIKDERNMLNVGSRIQKDLDNIDISTCLTIDKENTNELFISNEKNLWIYNYNLTNGREQGVFSKAELNDKPTCWLRIDDKLFFGTDTGLIMLFDEAYTSYNGASIDAHWEMNMYDFGAEYILKTLNKSWLTFASQPIVNADIQYITDRNAYSTPYNITYNLITFADTDFADFTFYTNYNPQTFYLRLKAKKFKYLKLVLDSNSTTSTFVLLNLTLKAEYGSEAK